MLRFYKVVLVVETIMLVALIVAFRAELTASGARLYLAFKENPRAERYLADYYHYTSIAEKEFSEVYRSRALASLLKYDKAANDLNETKERIAIIKMNIGRFHECGRATLVNLEEAKKWYQEAIKIDDNKHPEYQQDLSRVNEAIGKGTPPVCIQKDERYYSLWKW